MSSLTNTRFARQIVSMVQRLRGLVLENNALRHSNEHLLEVIEEYKRLQREEYEERLASAVAPPPVFVAGDMNVAPPSVAEDMNPDSVNPDSCDVNP